MLVAICSEIIKADNRLKDQNKQLKVKIARISIQHYVEHTENIEKNAIKHTKLIQHRSRTVFDKESETEREKKERDREENRQ